jgi:thiol-disulfide isomerase/thioredoxin
VAVTGASLPVLPKDGTDAAVGSKAPRLAGANFVGDPIVIEPGKRATLVVFVAHWCSHCQREVPLLRSWMETAAKPADVDIAFVSTSVTSGRSNYPPSKWLSTGTANLITIKASVLADDARSTAAEAYGLTSFPYFVMLNADGTVAERGVGELSVDELGTLIAKARR